MRFEVRSAGEVLGITNFENGDPPVGIVSGDLVTTDFYSSGGEYSELKLFTRETNEEVPTEWMSIEDFSQELGESLVHVTALLKSAQDYANHFQGHIDAYHKQFS